MPQDGTAYIKSSVIYEAVPGSLPIIFHNCFFVGRWAPREGYRLYRRQGDKWENIVDDTTCYMIVDEPDIAVNVSQDEDFTSLQPGESWTTWKRVEGRQVGILPDEVNIGDVFRYVLKGVELNWWDWGSTAEHKETIVKLPCFIAGRVVEPKDNGGRPKLVVPASNSVEFTIV